VLDLVERVQPDVVVTDIRMPPTQTDEGIRLAAQLRMERPEVGVVVLSQYTEPAYALGCSRGAPPGGGTFSRSVWSGSQSSRTPCVGWRPASR